MALLVIKIDVRLEFLNNDAFVNSTQKEGIVHTYSPCPQTVDSPLMCGRIPSRYE